MRKGRAAACAALALSLAATACHSSPHRLAAAPRSRSTPSVPPVSPIPARTFRGTRPPDIFYVVLDDYGGARALREQLGFDETPFLDSLRRLGFFVPTHPTSNYARTEMSLASQQNLDYLQALVPHPPADRSDVGPMIRLLSEPRLMRVLKSHGYRYVHMGSWWKPTKRSPLADEEIAMPRSQDDVARLVDVPLPQPARGDRLGTFLWDRREYLRVLWQFHELPRIRSSEPTFVFAHILAPHHPESFSANGDWVPLSKRGGSHDPTAYVNEVRFVDTEVLGLVRTLVAASPQPPPVIVLQSDEGFYSASPGFGHHPKPTLLQQHFGTFAAYSFPNLTASRLYDTITPVNVFRLLLDDYFGAGLPMLPDRNYAFPNVGEQWSFEDVTSEVRAVS
jgi:Sulfatase